MYKYGLLVSLFLALQGCGVSAPPGTLSQAAVTPGDIQSDPASVFFGSLCPADADTRSATLTNVGADPREIFDIFASGGGFLVLDTPRLPLVLASGDSANVVLRFSPPRAQLAPFIGSMLVLSDDPIVPDLNVSLEGLSLPGTLSATPRSIDFGDLAVGTARSKRVRLTNSGQCDITLDSFTVTGTEGDAVTVDDTSGVTLGSGESLNVNVGVDCFDSFDVDASVHFRDSTGRSLTTVHVMASCL